MSSRSVTMSLQLCVLGIFLISVIVSGDLDDEMNIFTRKINDYEDEICEPGKRHLDEDGCGDCICRSHGYGSICGRAECARIQKRPLDERECVPFGEFTTRCHYCKCSSAGNPIGCVEKSRRCMERILDELDEERYHERQLKEDNFRKEEGSIIDTWGFSPR